MENKQFKYLGFDCEATIIKKGFNMWDFTAVIYKNKGFKEEEYCYISLNTYEHKYSIAVDKFKRLLEDCVNTGLSFKSNGYLNDKNRININAELNSVNNADQTAVAEKVIELANRGLK